MHLLRSLMLGALVLAGPTMAQTGSTAQGCGPATLLVDNPGNTNPFNYTLQGSNFGLPVIGGFLTLFLDANMAGNNSGFVIGYLSPVTVALGGGQILLVNTGDPAGPVLQLPLQAQPIIYNGLPIPNDPSLCGLVAYTQGVTLGGGPFTLSNRLTFVIGF